MKKYKLGDYIERSTANNRTLKYKEDLIVGVTSDGVFSTPKGNVNGVDLTPYKIVNNGDFVYNPSRFDLGSIAYRTEGLCIVSHLYQIFHLNDKGKEKIDPIWLFIYLRRKEFRREVTFRNFGSQRPEFNFNDLSEIELPLPTIDKQRKYVDIYLALQNNLAVYQSKVDELKLVCDGYIEELRRKIPCERIGEYIVESNIKNSDNKIKEVRSVSVTKEFKHTNAKVNKNELSSYLVVNPKEIAFVQTTGNEKVLAFAYNDYDYPVVVSSVDKVFGSKNESILDLQYLALFLSRKEFDRYARFNSWGSAREVFTMDDMNDVEIPIPNIKVQQEIVNIHKCYIERQRIADALKEQINNIYPVLIRGSLIE
ncbi:MAG: restriction endonuclease subunit S [Bacteroidales bacterium]|nr:restriction endonuclease subunit S [Bacteroidales bacterium]